MREIFRIEALNREWKINVKEIELIYLILTYYISHIFNIDMLSFDLTLVVFRFVIYVN